jgi:hypothetical protein
MRNYLLFLLAMIIAANAFSQPIIDAGPDTTYCTKELNQYIENVTVVNAVGSFKITWECAYDMGIGKIFTASSFLDDTTTLRPKFIDKPIDSQWVTFKVSVVDSTGTIGTDYLRVRFSSFVYTTNYYRYNINKGDSIQLPGIAIITAQIEPIQIFLAPTFGIPDSTNLASWVKPAVNTQYYQWAIDSVGCISDQSPYAEIEVNSTDIKNSKTKLAIEQYGSVLYFNSLNNQQFIALRVYNLQGSHILSEQITANFIDFEGKLPKNEVFIILVMVGKNIYYHKYLHF